ncbi:hypothetical protein BN1708_009402 [Verticillium longisporum]|uniref:RSE1/DDB1/CPSF1 first beta-propeller domain-containing protein n=1 Tax=Verticillium longisporum TaxID=100787 RepID=A0A0G4KHS7_VERLO|nr:hypothetical protein BN1708_009402 [Verticillium longisporum]
MAFQTNVFRDGEWRTETVHISTILQKSAATPAAPTPVLPEAPACGILTRTLVQSPLVHWILPTHLRSARYNDVAFVGDHYVQINELGDGGELREVLRKDDFGARIQNAHVIGNTFERLEAGDSEVAFGQLKEEDDEALMDANLGLRPSPSSHAALPPHLLLLVLANGTLVFLFVRRLGERFEFVTSEFRHPDARLGTLGYHVAVDPKSRYIAVADMENTFVVYELQSWETMSQQYSQHSSISPVKSWSPRPVNGLVHKMEFLHPRPEDDYHVILLLVILKHGASAPKMILYDWERGDDVCQILAEDKDGHRLPREHRMPLFLIPLTIRNSFFIVSENSLAVCKDPLQGPPQYVTVDAGAHPKTRFHYGTQPPMWTAWDRPVRRRGYYDNKDNIYLAREDGVIVFFEFDTIDLLATGMNVGNCNSNISTAFTTMYDAFSDVAIISGDSGPGMVCQLRPRKPIVELGIIPNWSPTLDFVTTDQSTSWRGDAGQRGAQTSRWSKQYRDQAARHDRIFCVSGTGIQGSITELRQGISANIGWEIAYDTAIRQAWVFEAQLNDIGPGYYLLLALPDSSDILQVPRDSLEASRPNPGGPDFDTTARTLAAAQCSEQIIAQVTESAISLITPLQSSRQPFSSFEGVQGNAEHATVRQKRAAISTHGQNRSLIHVFYIEDLHASLSHTFETEGEVTCLAFCRIGRQECILSGVWRENHPYMAVFPMDNEGKVTPSLTRLDADVTVATGISSEPSQPSAPAGPTVEPITSIALVEEGDATTSIALGSRSGHLITLMLNCNDPSQTFISRERIGSVALRVVSTDNTLCPGSVLACCDDNLLLLSSFDTASTGKFRNRQRILANDVKDPTLAAPLITSATSMQNSIGQANHISLLLLAKDRILVTEMLPKTVSMPRSLPLHGTPTRILFSQTLSCLVVAMKVGPGQTTIAFVDPDTGENLSMPTDKDSNPLPFINGLGLLDDRIHDMFEWLYVKEGKTWLFIVITTRDGQLLIITTQRVEVEDADGRVSEKIRHWTRYKKKVADQAIYAGVGDGADLFFCAGNILHWEALDLVEKKLKPKKTFALPSPATSLRIVNDQLCALTTNHSLLVLNHKAEGRHDEMTFAHSDVGSRKASHYIEMGNSCEETPAWPITLISEQTHDFVGVWVPWKEPEKEFRIVFKGRLPAGVRRLRRGHVRPAWMAPNNMPRYGHIPSTVDAADVLAICMDGSLHHFTLLSPEALVVLELIQKLAVQGRSDDSPTARLSHANGTEPSAMAKARRHGHVDGNVLQRCLDKRALEALLSAGDGADVLLRDALENLEGGRWTASFGGQREKYVDLAYEILEYFLAPVF